MTPLSRDDLEALSAYLDGALSPKERAALESRLTADPDLRTALDELRRTVNILRAAPRVVAPRNYTLDPALYSRRAPWWTRLDVFRTVGMLGAAASTALIVIGVLLGSSGALPASAPMTRGSNEVAMQASRTSTPRVEQSAAAPTIMPTPSPLRTSTPAATLALVVPLPSPTAAQVGEDAQAASRQADSAAAGGMLAPSELAPGAAPPLPGDTLTKPTLTALADFAAQAFEGELGTPGALATPEPGAAAVIGESGPALSAQGTFAAPPAGVRTAMPLPTRTLLPATAERTELGGAAPAATTAKSAPPPVQMTAAVEERATRSPAALQVTPTGAALASLPTAAPATEYPQEARDTRVENPLPRVLIVAGLGLLVISAVIWLIGRARRSRP